MRILFGILILIFSWNNAYAHGRHGGGRHGEEGPSRISGWFINYGGPWYQCFGGTAEDPTGSYLCSESADLAYSVQMCNYLQYMDVTCAKVQ